jgi:Mrp family chromosome partitioning ATPase
MNALSRVIDPELQRNIVELGMVRSVQVREDQVEIEVALTTAACPLSQTISDDIRAAVKNLPGVLEVNVRLSEMTAEEKEAALQKAQPALPKASQFNKVGRIVAIMSGKGGVGKSSVTAILALALTRRGYKVGILDADVTGASIPKLLGVAPGGIRSSAFGMLPAITDDGIRVISINLLLPEESMAVIWRGPLISNAIQQFWNEVLWGHLDYLLVDLPPGTSDAALTVMQNLSVSGVVIVTAPQSLSAMVVRKAVDMVRQLNVPVLGVIENMSYFECPDSGRRYEVFGPSHAEEVADAARAPVLARLPIDPDLSRLGDSGQIATYNGKLIDELGKAFEAECPLPRQDKPD